MSETPPSEPTRTIDSAPPAAAQATAPKVSDDLQNTAWENNRDTITAGMANGNLMPLKPQHMENYDNIKNSAAKQGYTDVDMVLDTVNSSSYATTFSPTGPGKATLTLKQEAIKPTAAFDTDFTEHQIKNGRYEILTDELAANRAELAHKAVDAGYTQPARVVVSNIGDEKTPASSKVVAPTSPDGAPTIVANFNAVETTEAFAKKYQQISDNELNQKVKDGKFIPASEAGVSQEVSDHLTAVTSRNGRTPAKLYLDLQAESETPRLAVSITQEGVPFVKINKQAMEFEVSAQNAAVDHENGHLVNGDNTARGISDYHNKIRLAADPDAISRAKETSADDAGIRNSDNPQQSAKDSVKLHTLDSHAVAQFLMKNDSSLTFDQAYDKARNTTDSYPSDADRIYNARKTAAEIDAPLVTPGATGTVRAR